MCLSLYTIWLLYSHALHYLLKYTMQKSRMPMPPTFRNMNRAAQMLVSMKQRIVPRGVPSFGAPALNLKLTPPPSIQPLRSLAFPPLYPHNINKKSSQDFLHRIEEPLAVEEIPLEKNESNAQKLNAAMEEIGELKLWKSEAMQRIASLERVVLFYTSTKEKSTILFKETSPMNGRSTNYNPISPVEIGSSVPIIGNNAPVPLLGLSLRPALKSPTSLPQNRSTILRTPVRATPIPPPVVSSDILYNNTSTSSLSPLDDNGFVTSPVTLGDLNRYPLTALEISIDSSTEEVQPINNDESSSSLQFPPKKSQSHFLHPPNPSIPQSLNSALQF